MSGTGDLEDVKRAIAQRLRSARFLEILAGVDAEKADGSTTPAPAEVAEGERAFAVGQAYPVGAVIGARTAYASEANVEKDAAHEIQVVWTVTGDDELQITRYLERLVRATRDLFWNQSLEELHTPWVLVRGDEYSALMPTDEHPPFIKAASTQLLVTTYSL